mmetsp:Transcript_7714/g.7133  ORF Transcript_7714/g.7133 Transcript_7714/m.7133 type:complete len:100 (+) Transcript_7714:445-744(+)
MEESGQEILVYGNRTIQQVHFQFGVLDQQINDEGDLVLLSQNQQVFFLERKSTYKNLRIIEAFQHSISKISFKSNLVALTTHGELLMWKDTDKKLQESF